MAPLYSAVMRLRAFCYRVGIFSRYQLPVPVVSIGNLTMGGTGKTPMVIHVAKLLQNQNNKVVILSRGYGGKATGQVNIVSDGVEILLDAATAGDEPRLLADTLSGVPVLTGAKRTVTGRYAVENFGPGVVLLDDGFQHMAIARDLDLVLFSAATLLGNGWVFPGGELREPQSALGRAHCFIITGVDDNNRPAALAFKKYLADRFSGKPVFFC
ncbi:MAG: tetraacyldisaccharide 4'-kinase [Proteobacteria bacterium]|nr:tetraacyldisaccharide 4'-kinase [Pseudomonadota bacterium]